MNDKPMWENYRDGEAAGSCPDLLTLSAWIDRTLNPEEVEEVETHLSRCDRCLDHTLALRQTSQAAEDVPVTVTLETLPQLATTLTPANRPGWRPWQQLAASVVFALVLSAGYVAGRQSYTDEALAQQALLSEALDRYAVAWDEMPVVPEPDRKGGAS